MSNTLYDTKPAIDTFLRICYQYLFNLNLLLDISINDYFQCNYSIQRAWWLSNWDILKHQHFSFIRLSNLKLL